MSYLESDYRRTVTGEVRSRVLPGTSIEIVREVERPGRFRHVLFDFDGTLSLIREGWPEVMVPMMVEALVATGTREPEEALRRHCHDFVMRLNGKQTIYQMIQLAAEVRARGGVPREPAEYKKEYHERLMERIGTRRNALAEGRAKPSDFLVPGALDLLAALRDRGLPMYLASGTDEQFVVEEAALLGLTPFFGPHVYGAIDDFKSFSKKMVIERILRENQVEGEALVAFGDGYVEIENVKAAGGVAVAVASDEAGRSGRPDEWKRDRLIGVGADVVIPDFREWEPLVEYLLPAAQGRP
ncbi:MAG TPA: HAD family hydrolase [Vicinamibacterales bacterium]|nr:HAD family hydrolase [Vicinamibacterales bacterium]